MNASWKNSVQTPTWHIAIVFSFCNKSLPIRFVKRCAFHDGSFCRYTKCNFSDYQLYLSSEGFLDGRWANTYNFLCRDQKWNDLNILIHSEGHTNVTGHSQRTSGWPRGGGSEEFGCSIVVRVWFYCFIRTQGGGGSRNPGFSRTSFVNGPKMKR